MKGMAHRFLVTPHQVLSMTRQAGLADEQLALSGIAALTFSKAVIERLEELCGLKDAEWISGRHHPYAAAEIVKRGKFQEPDVTVVVPPMGASPLSCIIEDLITCGVKAVFLVCAAWSLGPPVQFGDLIVPTFSIGPDGTSLHYGNAAGEVQASQDVVNALTEACRAKGTRYHVGGNATCEALYRITPQMVEDFRKRDCLTMENGEASTLLTMAQELGFLGGVLFQPYIDLEHGWDSTPLRDEKYRATCRIQAEVLLDASIHLTRQGLLQKSSHSFVTRRKEN